MRDCFEVYLPALLGVHIELPSKIFTASFRTLGELEQPSGLGQFIGKAPARRRLWEWQRRSTPPFLRKPPVVNPRRSNKVLSVFRNEKPFHGAAQRGATTPTTVGGVELWIYLILLVPQDALDDVTG